MARAHDQRQHGQQNNGTCQIHYHLKEAEYTGILLLKVPFNTAIEFGLLLTQGNSGFVALLY